MPWVRGWGGAKVWQTPDVPKDIKQPHKQPSRGLIGPGSYGISNIFRVTEAVRQGKRGPGMTGREEPGEIKANRVLSPSQAREIMRRQFTANGRCKACDKDVEGINGAGLCLPHAAELARNPFLKMLWE